MTTQNRLNFSTLDILALKYRDKVHGNTYFSCQVYLDYGLSTQKSFRLPYQYGYGSQFEQAALEDLARQSYIPTKKTSYNANKPLSLYELKDQYNIIIRSISIWSKKKHVKDLGQGNYDFYQLCDA